MSKIMNGKKLDLGVCYYPEHWPKENWDSDLTRMKAAGISVVRVAEFAWNLVEPREGEFTFDYWQEFLDLAQEKEVGVIFGTPTATPPAWLTEKYPEVLNRDMHGNVIYHGARRHYNYNSPIYQKLCARIVEEEAKHFASHPAIIGWQIDNELNCEADTFYSDSDTLAFRQYLQEHYHSIEELNRRFGTVFWNQTYNDFSQIYVPRHTNSDAQNPHLLLAYKRFISESVNKFAHMQAEIIRKYKKPEDFITTNGVFANIDYQKMEQESLDFMTYDSYPNFSYRIDTYSQEDVLKDRRSSRNLSEIRAISKNFGIMEQQSGANGWYNTMEAPTPAPGQITLWTMQSIAHGADFISYFRWRTCTFGTEMYWHGILDYSGRENRRLQEVTNIGEKLEKLKDLAGSSYVAQVAILKDYDNEWDADVDRWHGRIKWPSEMALFTQMQHCHTPFDFLYFSEEAPDFLEKMKKYKLIFYPHPELLNQSRMDLLTNYVEQGGTLVFGCRTGLKDMDGICVTDPLPGLAAPLTGADVQEYSLIPPQIGTVRIRWGQRSLPCSVFYEMVDTTESSDAALVATYENGDYAGSGALIRHEVGAGQVYYLGTGFTEDLVEAFLEETLTINPFYDFFSLPKDVELAVRENEHGRYFFLLNYLAEEVKVTIKVPLLNLLDKVQIQGEITMKPYEVFTLFSEK